MTVFTLSRNTWKKFKTDNDLSKSSFFKKADVGPTIEKFQSSYEKLMQSKGQKDLMTCHSRCLDLQKAFDKFIDLKEAKGELKPAAKTQLNTWKKELAGLEKLLKLLYANYKDDMAQKDKDDMIDRLDGIFAH